MNSVSETKNIDSSANRVGHQYNHQHLVFVTKYRNRIFQYQEVIDAVRRGITEMCERLEIEIIEFSFGDDYAHVHLEANIPNKYSISHAVQALKSHSASVALHEAQITKSWFLHGEFGMVDTATAASDSRQKTACATT